MSLWRYSYGCAQSFCSSNDDRALYQSVGVVTGAEVIVGVSPLGLKLHVMVLRVESLAFSMFDSRSDVV